jgi:hypothetical protein
MATILYIIPMQQAKIEHPLCVLSPFHSRAYGQLQFLGRNHILSKEAIKAATGLIFRSRMSLGIELSPVSNQGNY